MTLISRRHHYIPEYFIKGFISPNTKLWVYDKVTDSILPNTKSPKSIFFDWNKNTITIDKIETDFPEEFIYKYIDNTLSTILKNVQANSYDSSDYNYEIIDCIRSMAFFTFYRSPATKNIIESYINNNKLKYVEFLRNRINDSRKVSDRSWDALLKHLLPFIHSSLVDKKENEDMLYYQIVDCPNSKFILSDCPILFEDDSYQSLLSNSIIFPLTSNRLYLGLRHKKYTFNLDVFVRINLLLAVQSNRYFSSSDKEFLTKIVTAYRIIKPVEELGTIQYRSELFDTINK